MNILYCLTGLAFLAWGLSALYVRETRARFNGINTKLSAMKGYAPNMLVRGMAIVACVIGTGVVISRFIPVHVNEIRNIRYTHEYRVHTVKVEDVIKRAVPPPEAIRIARLMCGGDPVRVLHTDTDQYDGKTRTWLQVEPVGGGASVNCHTGGDYSEELKPGVITRLIGYTLTNDPAED